MTSARWRIFGAEDPQVLAGGHSHVASMLAAIHEGRGPSRLRGAVAYAADARAGAPRDAAFGDGDYWDLLVEAGAGRTVALAWNGNQHNANFLVAAQPPFRVYDPLDSASDALEGVWVAEEALREYWEPTFSELGGLLERLGEVARVVVLGTPPPKPQSLVRNLLRNESLFVNQARALGMDAARLEVTPEPVRLALWRIVQTMLGEYASNAGAEFLAVPESAIANDGLLLMRYSIMDVTHANAAFGALMWSSLEQMLIGEDR